MSIEAGQKYIDKDGEVVEIKDITETVGRDEVIYYKCKQNKLHVMYDYDFLEQYKPYEVVYEYQWAYKRSTDTKWTISDTHWIGIPCLTPDEADYQRLDFTKRERKQ